MDKIGDIPHSLLVNHAFVPPLFSFESPSIRQTSLKQLRCFIFFLWLSCARLSIGNVIRKGPNCLHISTPPRNKILSSLISNSSLNI